MTPRPIHPDNRGRRRLPARALAAAAVLAALSTLATFAAHAEKPAATAASPAPPAPPAASLEATVTAMAKVGAVWSPAFSPDGREIAFVSTLTGVPQVWRMPVDGGFPRQVTAFDDPIQAISWSPDGRYLAFTVYPQGGENSQIYLAHPDGTDLHRITDGGKETNDLGPWTHDGRFLFLSSSRDDPATMDTYLYEPATGALRLLIKNAGLGDVQNVSDDDRRAVLWRMEQRIDENLFVVDLASGSDELLTPHRGAGFFTSGKFAGNATVYLHTSQDRDLMAFGRVRLGAGGKPGPIEIVAARPDAELQEFEISHDGKTAAVIWNVGGKSEGEFRDLATGRVTPMPAFPTEIGGDLRFSPDDRRLALVGFGSAAPPDLYVLDRDAGRIRQLTFSPHPGVDLGGLVRPELVRYRSFDGLEISGWLYRPAHARYPAPLVLVAHGGPEEQERPSFLGTYQALLARGIAIFAPNFRGSSGFGKAFQNLDNRELRVNVVKDVKAGLDALVARGIADPARLGMFGFSYGGYLTLAAIAEYPHLFSAAAELSGIVDFQTFFAQTVPWMAAISTSEYGDPVKDKALLAALSPIHRLDGVVTPTLVLHGANDTNVPVIEAEQVVENLKRRGVPVDYVLFPDEGHGVEKVKNRIRYALAIVGWFEKYLAPAADARAAAGRR